MSEAGYGTVELLVPVLFELKRQNNVQRDASRRARLAVWCSSLTRESLAGTVDMLTQPAWFHNAAVSLTIKSRVR